MQLNPGSYLLYNQLQKCQDTPKEIRPCLPKITASDTSVSIPLTLFLSTLKSFSSKNKVSEHSSVLPATFPRGEGEGEGERRIFSARSSTGPLSPNKLESVKYFCNWLMTPISNLLHAREKTAPLYQGYCAYGNSLLITHAGMKTEIYLSIP